MNNDLYFDGKKFISSSRAAKISGYVNDYIGQLCRDGKLECKMVGRSWYVSFDSLIAHKNAFGNGTKSRSQKHIRKIALIRPEIEKERGFDKRIVNEFTHTSVYTKPSKVLDGGLNELTSNQIKISRGVKILLPSMIWGKDTLPHVSYVLEDLSKNEEKRDEHAEFLTYMFPRAVAVVLSLFVAFSAFWFSLQSNREAQLAYSGVIDVVRDRAEEVFAFTGESLQANVFSGTKYWIDRTGYVVYKTVNDILYKTKRRIVVMVGKEQRIEIFQDATQTKVGPKQGMVVVPTDPSTDKQALVTKIKSSFSDEVTITPNSNDTDGVITPVFKKGKGDEYLYVLVPIKN